MIDSRAAGLASGDRSALAKAITLAESSREQDRLETEALLAALVDDREMGARISRSVRIGISGTPGVGKSTFIEAFGLHLLRRRRRVAVLAVDPSSPVAGGSVLGDKTRMEALSRKRGAFIRPSPSGGVLGGVSLRTREAMLLCEAAGFGSVLVETVGVGQSEHEVADMVDLLLLLVQPDTGDELQGIKRGILELADLVIINKADGAGRKAAQQDKIRLENALGLVRGSAERPGVLLCSAVKGEGIAEVWEWVQKRHRKLSQNGSIAARRAAQRRAWLEQLLGEMLQRFLWESPAAAALHHRLEKAVEAGQLSPHRAARRIFNAAFPSA